MNSVQAFLKAYSFGIRLFRVPSNPNYNVWKLTKNTPLRFGTLNRIVIVGISPPIGVQIKYMLGFRLKILKREKFGVK